MNEVLCGHGFFVCLGFFSSSSQADRDRGSVDRKGPGAKTTPNDSGVPTISLNKKQSLVPPVQPAVDVDSPSNNATSTTTIEAHSDGKVAH